jgi:thiol-disulfide isomerase/thioredoxin
MWLDPRERIHAPEIEGEWLNSPSLRLAQLRGRVVLVLFWDYTCVNCLRTLPHVREWHRRYARSAGAGILPPEHGLVVIGVHAPEFHFSRDRENVERAVRHEGLDYPIVLDNEYRTWQAFANHCWPAKYLIDAQGYIRYVHLGEGQYRETEDALQRLLREAGVTSPLPVLFEPARSSTRSAAYCVPVTPELYLGYGRGRLGNESGYIENQVADYRFAGERGPDLAYLEGPWFAGREQVVACPLLGRESRLRVRYVAAEVNLVMAPPDSDGLPVEGRATVVVRQDGRPLTIEESGADIMLDGDETVIDVAEPRMYRLVRNREAGTRELEIWTRKPGLEAYAFTFVPCADHQALEAGS